MNQKKKNKPVLSHISEKVELKKGDKIVCMLQSKFNPESNEIYKNEDAKSYPRKGKKCFNCGGAIVMSNVALAKKPKPNQIICLDCMVIEISNHETQ